MAASLLSIDAVKYCEIALNTFLLMKVFTEASI